MTTTKKTEPAQENAAVIEMTEEQMRNFVRNALMVAGQEMGETGDHWPVIKQTITDVMSSWEGLGEERAVFAETEEQLFKQLASMEQTLMSLPAQEAASLAPRLKRLREVYEAFFTKVKNRELAVSNDEAWPDGAEKPLYVRRAEAILETLEEDHG